MNVQPAIAPTETEAAFAAAYRSARESLPDAGDGRLLELRDAAFARFAAAGLPHRRIEAWHYTDLKRHLRELPDGAVPAKGPASLDGEPLSAAFAALDPLWLVFVDGHFAPGLSGPLDGAPGAEIALMSVDGVAGWALEALASGGAGKGGTIGDLNVALMGDGAMIRIAAGMRPARPIGLLHLGHVDGVRHVRHVVVVGEGASLVLIEAHGALGVVDEVATSAITWTVGDRAEVDHLKVQGAAPGATHLAPHTAEIGAEARFSTFTLSLGAGLAREERHVRCAGPASRIHVSGAYYLDGHQHGDTTLVVTHAAPGCESRERYKGVVDGEARGVFQGRVIVEPGAQKTDARQSVDALLLSDTAEQNAKPELEIYADDVQCGHGATTGEVDADALFYLRARGLPASEAERLLIEAFLVDGLSAISHEDLRQAALTLAEARLAARGGPAHA